MILAGGLSICPRRCVDVVTLYKSYQCSEAILKLVCFDSRLSVRDKMMRTAGCFYPRDAMLARVFATATCPSVCPSVAGIVPSTAKAGS